MDKDEFNIKVVEYLSKQTTILDNIEKNLSKLASQESVNTVCKKVEVARVDEQQEHREMRNLLYKVAGLVSLIATAVGVGVKVI